jgi:hypothetical protein
MKTLTKVELRDQLLKILNFKTWTKNVLAKNNKGKEVKPTSKNAVRWCAMGLAYKFYRIGDSTALPLAWVELRQDFINIYNKSIIEANDELGFKAIKKMLINLY